MNSLHQIESKKNYSFALHHLGFRPFFLLAGIYAVVVTGVWLWVLSLDGGLPHREQLGPVQWHGHEMLFGYGVAVYAGFLLTAERNWTGVQTLHGAALLLLAVLWVVARVMALLPYEHGLLIMAVMDLLFDVLLCAALLYPIVKVRQWQQLGVWLLVLFCTCANVVFYLGLFNKLEDGERLGVHAALYLILALIFLMARRVIPFFIEKGVGYPVSLRNYRWLDVSSVLLLMVFMVLELFSISESLVAITAVVLALMHGLRLQGWYSKGIWRKPLLWILYIGYGWLVAGFVLKAVSAMDIINPSISVHAFAYGGIGMITLGMMARVALGHTGRDVFNPPKILFIIFILILAGALVRVIAPLLFFDSYALWLLLSQCLWISAFAGFTVVYTPVLIKGRIDGGYG